MDAKIKKVNDNFEEFLKRKKKRKDSPLPSRLQIPTENKRTQNTKDI